MARRRGSYGWGRNTATAPPPIAIKVQILDPSGLKTAYEWMVLDKILGFKLAFEWYANNTITLLHKDALDADRQKTYDRATKAKSLGDSATIEFEKIQAWSTALHLYEKVWSAKDLPKVDDGLNATVTGQHIQDVQAVLANLNGAFAQSGARFRVTFNPEREFLEGEILIPSAELDVMIGMAPLKVILGEVITVAKVTGLVTDAKGNTTLDGEKFMANLPVVLANVYAWAMHADKLTRPLGKAPKLAKVKATSTSTSTTSAGPRAPRPRLNQVINVINLGLVRVRGKRLLAVQAMVDGMTISQYKQVLTSIPGVGVAFMTVVPIAEAAGAIRVV